MKIFRYLLLLIVLLLGGFFAWFFLFHLQLPELIIPEDATEEEKITGIDNWLGELEEAYKFNGAVLIARNSEPLLMKGYGFADPGRTERLNPASSFRLASVSKQFTATGIMLLAEQGELTFDDPVSLHIEGFPYPAVSIRHLLNQTSGVPDVYMELAENKQAEIPVLSNEKAVELVVEAARPAVFKAGTQYQYSNTNYILLARITEVISGLSFEDYMEAALFRPLGMKHTRVWNLLSADEAFPHKVADVQQFKRRMKLLKPSFIDGVAGDGAVFSSLSDFLIWDAFWYEGSLISESTKSEAFTPPALTGATTSDYGFGWTITENGMWHNGSWLGARTLIVRNTERKTCLVVLDNSSNIMMDDILKPLEAVFREF